MSSPTIRHQIVDDIVAMLQAGADASYVIERGRTAAIDPLATPKTIMVYWDKDTVTKIVGQVVYKRVLDVKVECRAPATDSTTAEQEADTLAAWVSEQLSFVMKGVQSAKLYHILQESETESELDQADTRYCKATVHIQAEYQHRVSDAGAFD